MNNILSQLDVQFSREQIETLSQAITTDFQKYMTENNLLDPTQVQTYFMNYIATNRAQTLLQQQNFINDHFMELHQKKIPPPALARNILIKSILKSSSVFDIL